MAEIGGNSGTVGGGCGGDRGEFQGKGDVVEIGVNSSNRGMW